MSIKLLNLYFINVLQLSIDTLHSYGALLIKLLQSSYELFTNLLQSYEDFLTNPSLIVTNTGPIYRESNLGPCLHNTSFSS